MRFAEYSKIFKLFRFRLYVAHLSPHEDSRARHVCRYAWMQTSNVYREFIASIYLALCLLIGYTWSNKTCYAIIFLQQFTHRNLKIFVVEALCFYFWNEKILKISILFKKVEYYENSILRDKEKKLNLKSRILPFLKII